MRTAVILAAGRGHRMWPYGETQPKAVLPVANQPLIRHAIRYWELTLMMIERTGVQGKWADKVRSDLERVRSLMLEQPPGPGGIPPTAPTPEGEAGET